MRKADFEVLNFPTEAYRNFLRQKSAESFVIIITRLFTCYMIQTYFEFVCFRHYSVPRVQSEIHKHKILQNSLSLLDGVWFKAAIKGQGVKRISKNT